MREIKFKALKKHDWVYGLPFYSHGLGDWKMTLSNGWQPSYSNPDEGESTEYVDIDANTLCQFTGLKDKNGTEIYEGDILKIQNQGGEKLGFVKWVVNEYDFGWIASFPLSDVTSWVPNLFREKENIEVVGSIYETPEILI